MATQVIEEVPEGDAAAKGGKRTILMLAVGGIVAGVAAGLFAVGPVMTKRGAAKPAAAAHDSIKGVPVTYEIANLVLNPAGTGGMRFLMVTATFQVKDEAAKQSFKEHDAQLRDRILNVLGKRTVDELTSMTDRESIRHELIDSVATLFPKGAVAGLYFPQFVVQ